MPICVCDVSSPGVWVGGCFGQAVVAVAEEVVAVKRIVLRSPARIVYCRSTFINDKNFKAGALDFARSNLNVAEDRRPRHKFVDRVTIWIERPADQFMNRDIVAGANQACGKRGTESTARFDCLATFVQTANRPNRYTVD